MRLPVFLGVSGSLAQWPVVLLASSSSETSFSGSVDRIGVCDFDGTSDVGSGDDSSSSERSE